MFELEIRNIYLFVSDIIVVCNVSIEVIDVSGLSIVTDFSKIFLLINKAIMIPEMIVTSSKPTIPIELWPISAHFCMSRSRFVDTCKGSDVLKYPQITYFRHSNVKRYELALLSSGD